MLQANGQTCSGTVMGLIPSADIRYVESNCNTVETPTIKPTIKVSGKQAFVSLQIPVWDDVGCAADNIFRVYNTDDCVYHDGKFYWSLFDGNTDKPPSQKWSEGVTKCSMLKPASSAPSACSWAAGLPTFAVTYNTTIVSCDCPSLCDTIKNMRTL